jgi:DNA-directed RNA polymerase specialized sigma24 family protein
MNSVGPFTDQSFQDLQSGSNRAWAQFYDLLAPELRAYIVRLGAKDPDDILGETFAHAYRELHITE